MNISVRLFREADGYGVGGFVPITSEEVVTKIFYSPCTNGQHIKSIKDGIVLVESYADEQSQKYKYALERISKGPYTETVTGYSDYATDIAREALGIQ